jgi:hypothetical protein
MKTTSGRIGGLSVREGIAAVPQLRVRRRPPPVPAHNTERPGTTELAIEFIRGNQRHGETTFWPVQTLYRFFTTTE